MYVLDSNMKNTNGKLNVVAGQQSKEFYIATGKNEKEATNSPVLLEKLTIGLTSNTQSYLEFGQDSTGNVLTTN